MKTPSSKKNEATKSHSTKPFFEKNGNFFSPTSTTKSSFFTRPNIQTKLTVGQPNDRFEKEADAMADQVMQIIPTNSPNKLQGQNNVTQPQIMKSGKTSGKKVSPTLSNQLTKSKGDGAPLPATSNKKMSQKFGHDFSQVSVHTGEQANQMNQSLNAKAFTHGSDIYFKKGEYNPNSFAGQHLLAHELTHVVQQSGGQQAIQKQDKKTTTPPTPAPTTTRKDIVFVMGSDKKGFYTVATKFFKAKFPGADFVKDKRSLSELLTHLTTNYSDPLGNIFIISHANEDGTLSFKLTPDDKDKKLSVVELREALDPAGGISSLTTPTTQVDNQTRIKIKGCDLGRNQEIVELFDRAFNGKGIVSAPTHEQVYSYNSKDIKKGTAAAMKEHMESFEASLPTLPPKAEAVDKKLKGEERTAAKKKYNEENKAYNKAKKERNAAIKIERKRFQPSAKLAGQSAGTYESLSGPMFQRPGNTLFTAEDLQPKVDKLYDHLSEEQRKRLVAKLVKADSRKKSLAMKQGVYKQKGQRYYKYEVNGKYTAPQDLSQAKKAFARDFKKAKFKPSEVAITSSVSNDETTYEYNFSGKIGKQERTMTFTSAPIPSDQSLIDKVKTQINNPDKFTWSVEEIQQSNGKLVKKVIRERVVTYLHHGSLNVSSNERFAPPETDRRFFAESTFTPPTPPSTP